MEEPRQLLDAPSEHRVPVLARLLALAARGGWELPSSPLRSRPSLTRLSARGSRVFRQHRWLEEEWEPCLVGNQASSSFPLPAEQAPASMVAGTDFHKAMQLPASS